ncbi:MAG: hypothetical protein R3B84_09705 [Zavarzinella sp.]
MGWNGLETVVIKEECAIGILVNLPGTGYSSAPTDEGVFER